jgi:N-acetylmuramoyl-L-alanine amidase
VLLALLVAPASHAGQRAPAGAGGLYSVAVGREQALQAAVHKGAAPLLRDYRAVVNAFEAVARKHPTSGYVDDALWRGAGVAREAFERFGDDRDRATARRMLALLVSDYPLSPFVPKSRDLVGRLDPARPAAEKPSPPPSLPVPAPPPKPASSATPATPPSRGPVSLARQLGLGASRIVIDPGHGGHDPGALGEGVSEADVVLDVAIRLEALLVASGVDVMLTRRSDEFVPLDKRPAFATREQADLFLSIHANASRAQSARLRAELRDGLERGSGGGQRECVDGAYNQQPARHRPRDRAAQQAR